MSDPTLTVEARIPDALQPAVVEKLARATDEDVAGRVAREDATLWGGLGSPPAPPEIADRLGWLTEDGEYIEFSLDGAEMGRWDLPGQPGFLETTGFALSDQNDVIVGRFGKGHAELLELDRDAQTWARVTLPKDYTPSWAWIMGFDGTTLVADCNAGTLRRFNK